MEGHTGAVVRYWDLPEVVADFAGGDEWAQADLKRAWLAELPALLPPAPAEVLDLGCGAGGLSFTLAELGYAVTGIDLAEGMLAAARSRLTGTHMEPAFALGDVQQPPGAPGSFDVVVSRHVFWTLPEPARAAGAAFRLLKPGGSLILFESPRDDDNPWVARVEGEVGDAWNAVARETYSAAVKAALPLGEAADPAPFVEMLASAGFERLEIRDLPSVAAALDGMDSSGRTAVRRLAILGRRPERVNV